jgi:hypothetical protein
MAASVDDEQVSRQRASRRRGRGKKSTNPTNAGRERARRSQITSKDDLPPIKPQLRTASQHRVRAIHITVRPANRPAHLPLSSLRVLSKQ